MKKIIFSLLLLSTLLYSCNEDNDNNPGPTPSTYYIEGKVNGVMHHADYVCPYNGCESASAYYSQYMEWMQVQRRTSATDETGWDILIENIPDLDAWQVPVTYNAGQDLSLEYYYGPWGADNMFDVDGVALGDNSFTLTVTSKSSDVIEGTFSGTLYHGGIDSTVMVTEGKFKIHVVRN